MSIINQYKNHQVVLQIEIKNTRLNAHFTQLFKYLIMKQEVV